MRIFKVAEFGGWGGQEEKLAKFINEHNIKKEDIVKIIWAPNNTLHLFYYTEE